MTRLSRPDAASWALITGCLGGIGCALVEEFSAAGYRVLGTDAAAQAPADGPRLDAYLACDLERLAGDGDFRKGFLADARRVAGGALKALVNNAAWQVVKPVEALTAEDWTRSFHVNVLAPFLLIQGLLAELEKAGGSVVNIASIHAQATKPEFSAYATSKTALLGMTRSLAVELGSRVRINALCPAAISTPMLLAGFAGRDAAFAELSGMHPVGRIGRPEEVARAARLLCDDGLGFMTGSSLLLDGGIGGRLHDPV